MWKTFLMSNSKPADTTCPVITWAMLPFVWLINHPWYVDIFVVALVVVIYTIIAGMIHGALEHIRKEWNEEAKQTYSVFWPLALLVTAIVTAIYFTVWVGIIDGTKKLYASGHDGVYQFWKKEREKEHAANNQSR